MSSPDISEITRRSSAFAARIEELKGQLPAPEPGWYPYDSFGNFFTLDQLLTGPSRRLLDLAGDEPVADIGCGDGLISFFLESLGCRMQAFDLPSANYNLMRGAHLLKNALQSAVAIRELNIDRSFTLPETRYGLTLLFGVLYHLRNPFLVLEELARRSRYCLLSTRVARFTPDKKTDLHSSPVAYLVGGEETNQDETNYWIFSEAGLRRLVHRAGWDTVDSLTVGNTRDSDPASDAGDERAFCLLKSRVVDRLTPARLLSGWHELEETGTWRWTERVARLRFENVSPEQRLLRIEFTIPGVIWQAVRPQQFRLSVNGAELPPMRIDGPRDYRYEARVAPGNGEVDVTFELDAAMPPTPPEERELALIVTSVSLLSRDR